MLLGGILESYAVLFVLVFMRLMGLAISAPLLSRRDLPFQVRILLCIALGLVIAPLAAAGARVQPQNLVHLATLVAGEFLTGVLLGLGLMFLVQGMQCAGEMISRVAGIGMNDIYDPTSDSEVTAIAQFLFLVGLTTFLSVGGDRALLGGLLESFRHLPPGEMMTAQQCSELLVDMLQASFVLAIRVAAPALAALLVVTLVLGLISRTLPQLNLLMLGFGINGLAALGVILLTLGIAANIFENELARGLEQIFPWGF